MPAARTTIAAIVPAVIVLAAAVPTVTAAEREPQHAGARCIEIANPTARLACYDQAFDRSTGEGVVPAVAAGSASVGGAAAASSAAAPSTAAAAGTAAAASTAAAAGSAATPAGGSSDAARALEEFGLTETAKRKRDPEKAKETMPESISASVAKVSFRPTGEVVVTLDNDQVWEQAEIVTTKARVKAGDVVTIRKASLGSYTMVTASRMLSRVRRVR